MPFSRLTRWMTAFLVVSSLASVPSPARSDTLDADKRAKLEQLYKDATQKMEAKDFAGALESYGEMDKIASASPIRLQMARALVAMGKLLEAQKLMQDIARTSPQPGEKPSWSDARKNAAAEAQALSSRLVSLDVTIDGAKADAPATLKVDGQPVGLSLLSGLRFNPGSHVLRVEATGFLPAEKEVVLAEGEARKMTFKLEPIPLVAPPALSASASSVPVRPIESTRAETGREVVPERTEEPPPSTGGGGWLVPTGLVVLGVGAIAGTVTGVMSLSKVSSLKSDCPIKTGCPASSQSDIDSAKSLGTLSTIGFALAGAGAVLTVIGLVIKPSSSAAQTSSQTGAYAMPELRFGVGLGRLQLTGQF